MHKKQLKAKPAIAKECYYHSLDALEKCKAEQCTKEENKPMYTSNQNYNTNNNSNMVYDGTLENERNYLRNRVNTLSFQKVQELERQFGLRDDVAPKTAEEAIQRIKDGKFILRKLEEMDCFDHPVFDQFRWRDPSVKEDETGFAAAEKEWNAKVRSVLDAVEILSPTEALSKLQALN